MELAQTVQENKYLNDLAVQEVFIYLKPKKI